MITRPTSDHFNGKRFFQPGPPAGRGFLDLLRWRLTRRAAKWPREIPVPPAEVPLAPTGEGVTICWIGHSTFLLRSCEATWLTDPVFSRTIGPVEGWGPRRAAPPALRPDALPPIDGLLLSHDHYDHCDRPSLRALAKRGRDGAAPLTFSPLGYETLLPEFGSKGRLKELDWWNTAAGPGGARVTLLPARHWCRRRIGGTNERLWGGFWLTLGGRSVYFAGDTAFDEAIFRGIRERCGPPDVAMLPIGAYEPRWFMKGAHLNPEEAVRAHQILEPKLSLAMHWGTFALTDEPWDAPPRALSEALYSARISPEAFQVLSLGSSLAV